jgi:hypothetical protein
MILCPIEFFQTLNGTWSVPHKSNGKPRWRAREGKRTWEVYADSEQEALVKLVRLGCWKFTSLEQF